MLEAIAQAVAMKGYAGTTVGDVIARAGVSRKTFYEQFADKEDCFYAACTYVADSLYDTVARAIDAATTPQERLELLVRSYVRALKASPRGAIAFIIEARAATPKIREHHHQILERFADLVPHPDAPAADDPDTERLFRLAGVIIVEDIAAREIAEGRADKLPELENTLFELAARLVRPGPTEPVRGA
jgi:AcrR family transcriptional regulator